MEQEFFSLLESLVNNVGIPDSREWPRKLVHAGVNSFEGLLLAVSDQGISIDVRIIACEMLGLGYKVWDQDQCVRALLVALKNEDVRFRDVAARSLRYFAHKQSLHEISVRVAAIQTLQYIGDERAIEPLINIFSTPDETLSLRTLAAEVLGHLHAKRAVSALIEALSDSSAELRFYAAFSLGLIGDERALPELGRLAIEDQTSIPGMWSVSKEASDAIEKIKSRRRGKTGLQDNDSIS